MTEYTLDTLEKMTAALEAAGKDILYYENIEGGHGGSANSEQAAFMGALSYTFLWQKLQDSAEEEVNEEEKEEVEEE